MSSPATRRSAVPCRPTPSPDPPARPDARAGCRSEGPLPGYRPRACSNNPKAPEDPASDTSTGSPRASVIRRRRATARFSSPPQRRSRKPAHLMHSGSGYPSVRNAPAPDEVFSALETRLQRGTLNQRVGKPADRLDHRLPLRVTHQVAAPNQLGHLLKHTSARRRGTHDSRHALPHVVLPRPLDRSHELDRQHPSCRRPTFFIGRSAAPLRAPLRGSPPPFRRQRCTAPRARTRTDRSYVATNLSHELTGAFRPDESDGLRHRRSRVAAGGRT